ncbi:MAG: FAD-dependent oxidoreductase, partial [Candidatus Bathyarchaeota archaeon]
MTQYLIVGASAGAIGAVEGIRSLNPKGEITVLSEETLAPYSRPSISEYLDGRVSEESLRFGQSNFWEQNGVQTILGRKAIALDIETKKVQLDNGQSLSFDKLLLATGAKPIIPKIGGIDKDGFCTFSNVADVQRIVAKLPKTDQSVVIGGGLIGVAAAEALSNLGIEVTIVELRGWLLNILLDREAARIIESAIRSRGVRVVTGQSIQEVVGEDCNYSKVGGVVLSGGERFT